MEPIVEGFHEPATPEYIFVAGGKDDSGSYLWHRWDHDKSVAIPVHQTAFTGVLSKIVVFWKLYKNQKNYKMDISFKANGRTYVFRSGVETSFTRGLILALRSMEEPGRPVTLMVQPGEDEKIVFCQVNFADTQEKIKFEWDSKARLFEIIQMLQDALGQKVQTWEEVQIGKNPEPQREQQGNTEPPPQRETLENSAQRPLSPMPTEAPERNTNFRDDSQNKNNGPEDDDIPF